MPRTLPGQLPEAHGPSRELYAGRWVLCPAGEAVKAAKGTGIQDAAFLSRSDAAGAGTGDGFKLHPSCDVIYARHSSVNDLGRCQCGAHLNRAKTGHMAYKELAQMAVAFSGG